MIKYNVLIINVFLMLKPSNSNKVNLWVFNLYNKRNYLCDTCFLFVTSDGFVKTSSDYEAKRTNLYFELSERK